MCPLGRAVICEEGRIPHCVIHPHLTRHGRRHPLVSAGHRNYGVALCRIASCAVFPPLTVQEFPLKFPTNNALPSPL
jgi:hypothetical protein